MSMNSRVFINGRFLTQPTSGVQRYAREVVCALDNLINDDAEYAALRGRISLLTPQGSNNDLELSAIQSMSVGRSSGHVWEQFELPPAVQGGFLINLCNSGPIVRREQLVVLHDASIYRLPKTFSKTYRVLHKAIDWALAAKCQIATVSYFSAAELSDVLDVPIPDQYVLPNAGDHILSAKPDATILAHAEGLPFFLFVGGNSPRKRLDLVYQAASQINSDFVVLVTGKTGSGIFGNTDRVDGGRVRWVGQVSDQALSALYMNCRALLFPSDYEGFGVPLLEAAHLNCPVIATDIPSTVEVLGSGFRTVKPGDATALAAAMVDALNGDLMPPPSPTYSWRSTAKRLASVIMAPDERRSKVV